MEGLPECASESIQQKSTRFGKDVSAIGDELRTLLREIRKSYRHRPPPYETDDAAEDWFAYGCNEWFEPVSSVAPNVLDNLGEWASRFQRAARVVDVGKTIEGFSSPLENKLITALAQCLTSNWDRRTGNELMRVFGELTTQLEAFTEAVDSATLWQTMATPQSSANASQSECDQSSVDDYGETNTLPPNSVSNIDPVERAIEYAEDPAVAIADLKGILDLFLNLFVLQTHPPPWEFVKKSGVKDSDTLELDDGIGNFIRAVTMASAIHPKVFERLDKSVLTTFAVNVFTLNRCVDYTPPEVTERIIASLDAVFGILLEFADHWDLHLAVLERKMVKDAASQVEVDPLEPSLDVSAESSAVAAPPKLWTDADREVIADTLNGQQLKLFKLLWGKSRWTYYGDLKNARAEKLWRGQPDPANVEDGTVFEALRKLQKAMLPEWQYVVLIENESLRVKIERT